MEPKDRTPNFTQYIASLRRSLRTLLDDPSLEEGKRAKIALTLHDLNEAVKRNRSRVHRPDLHQTIGDSIQAIIEIEAKTRNGEVI